MSTRKAPVSQEPTSKRTKKVKVKKVNYTRIAASLGYSVSHISRICRGIKNPSVAALKRMARELGMSMDDLAAEIEKVKAGEKGRVKGGRKLCR